MEPTKVVQRQGLCIVGRIRAALGAADQADLDYMFTRPEKYSTRLIARTLTQHGFPVGKDAVHSHSLGDCKCPF